LGGTGYLPIQLNTEELNISNIYANYEDISGWELSVLQRMGWLSTQ